MFLTVHATAGVIIGQQTGNIWLAFLGGIISHIILDIIPHGDQDLVESGDKFTPKEIIKIRKIALIDMLIMSALLSAIYLADLVPQISVWPVLVAAFGAILPDFLSGFYALTNSPWLAWQFKFQHNLHYLFNGFTINFPQGIVVQTITLAIFITLITFL